MFQFPGPNENGLTYMKERSMMAPEGVGVVWFGFLNPAVILFHPDSVKAILKTSGKCFHLFIQANKQKETVSETETHTFLL